MSQPFPFDFPNQVYLFLNLIFMKWKYQYLLYTHFQLVHIKIFDVKFPKEHFTRQIIHITPTEVTTYPQVALRKSLHFQQFNTNNLVLDIIITAYKFRANIPASAHFLIFISGSIQ